ncbi:hypothetical protein [Kribbella deserti]|uniref:Uncharacterized protein n=1 Tax=Kribbella deserti TaxID=1926257 RepID=A0ABV6QE75_9ACTN
MDVLVLLIFAGFFATLTVAATANGGLLRASMRRTKLFQGVALVAGTVLVPLDLSVAAYGTIGGGQSTLADIAARLLLLNVAASCGIAALHSYLRRPGFASEDDMDLPTRGLASGNDGRGLASDLPATGGVGTNTVVMARVSATATNHVSARATEPALRLGVLGWVGPLVALVAVAGMVLLDQMRNHADIAAVRPVWAVYSVLICVISAYALLRQRARGAIDPQEG